MRNKMTVARKKRDVFFYLRLKLSLTMMTIVFIVSLSCVFLFNLYLNTTNFQNANLFLETIVANGGHGVLDLPSSYYPARGKSNRMWHFKEFYPADAVTENQTFAGRLFSHFFKYRANLLALRDFCSVNLDKSGNIINIITPFASVDLSGKSEEIVQYAFKQEKGRGRYKDFSYALTQKEYGFLLVVVDRSKEFSEERRFAELSLLFIFIILSASFFIVWLLSGMAIKPVKDAFVRQREFIADASHELKTPIAVIGANIDVMEQEIPGNKWLGYIRTENNRMSELVKNMLYLAKNDADKNALSVMKFGFFHAVKGSVLPFESVALESNKKMEIDVPDEEIQVLGDEARIKQLMVIFVDNALKNSEEGAFIRISAGTEGKRCFFKVYNTGHGIAAKDIPLIFDRFYRADSSRARSTGGYGLGLTIARSIAESHGGKISVKSEEGSYAEFTFYMPYC